MARLKIGDPAPRFKAMTVRGKLVDLESIVASGSNLWLAFYRYSECPLCLMHLAEVERKFAQLHKSGLVFVAIFESPREDFKTPGPEPVIDLNLVADPDGTLHKKYATEESLLAVLRPSVLLDLLLARKRGFKQGRIKGSLSTIPAHFLISGDGVVREAHYGRTISEQIPWRKVIKFLREHGAPLNDGQVEKIGASWNESFSIN